MKYLSVFSGIEAATVAWEPLGWSAVAYAEIEAFPSAVLAYHYPDVPNLGDITKFDQWPEELLAEVDLIIGGSPCQSFSIAGLRGGLSDARGNLALVFVLLINHIDTIRKKHGRQPVIVVWENVPGVLNTADNALGALVGALAGTDEPIESEAGAWPTCGVFWGVERRVGYRVLDAQYFGVAQRRRRVFLVAVHRELVEHFGNRADPGQILAVSESLRGDSTPSRKAGQRPTQSAAQSIGDSVREVSDTVTSKWAKGSGGPSGNETGNMVLQPIPINTMTAQGRPSDNGRMGSGIGKPGDPANTITKMHGHAVATPVMAFKVRGGMEGGGKGFLGSEESAFTVSTMQDQNIAVPQPIVLNDQGGSVMNVDDSGVVGTLRRETHGHEPSVLVPKQIIGGIDYEGNAHGPEDPTGPMMKGSPTGGGHPLPAVAYEPIPFDTTQITSKYNYSNPKAGDPCHPIASQAHVPAIAYEHHPQDSRVREVGDTMTTIKARAGTGGGNLPLVMHPQDLRVGSMPDTLYIKGIESEEGIYGSAEKTNARAVLSQLREEIGEEAFAQWGLGVFNSLQETEILQSDLHGTNLRLPAFSRSWVVNGPLSRKEDCSTWALQSVQEAIGERCSSFGWEPSEQRSIELGAYLSELSQQGASAKAFLQDMLITSRWFRVLRQTLPALQEMGRPIDSEAQSTHGAGIGVGVQEKTLLGSELPKSESCEGSVWETSHEDEKKRSDSGRLDENQQREHGLSIRRLLPEECEILQGLPRSYTDIPWRGRSFSPDGPRYKAIGNSMATPVVLWVGWRIAEAMK
jgi:site-specific DNA-cytosine methylase